MVKVWESSADTSRSSTNCILEKGLSVTDAGTTDNGDAEGKTRKGELNRITLFDTKKCLLARQLHTQLNEMKCLMEYTKSCFNVDGVCWFGGFWRHNSMLSQSILLDFCWLQKEFTFTVYTFPNISHCDSTVMISE